MTIVLAAPYTKMNPEIGLMYLLARYLTVHGHSVAQLGCNGVFGSCDRDVEYNWRRPIGGCFACMQEQREHAKWSDISSLRLSRYLTPDDIQETARWVNALSDEEVIAATIGGIPLLPLLQGSFEHRFGVDQPDPSNKLHDRFLRALILSAVRLLRAGTQFAREDKPELLVLPYGRNFIYQVLSLCVAAHQIPCVVLEANISKRCIEMRRAGTDSMHECPLLIEDVLSLRSDVKTWSGDLVRLLKEVEAFFGVTAVPAAVSAGK